MSWQDIPSAAVYTLCIGGQVRSLPCIAALILFSGCRFSWEANVDTDCAELRAWYLDGDDDQWGLAGDSQDACGPSGDYTAVNDRDCDDTDPTITGRSGSICPDQLVNNGGEPTQVVGVVVGASEVVAVHTSSAVVWARAAEDACGPVGWGGGLFAQSDPASIVQALDALPDGQEVWAGYIGIQFNPNAPFPGGGSPQDVVPGQWEFIGGGLVPEARLCASDGVNGADAADYSPDLGFLALIKDKPPLEGNGSSSDFCFGRPVEAVPLASPACGGANLPCYTERTGHFICQRTAPNSDDFAL